MANNGPLTTEERLEIFKRSKQGDPTQDIADDFGRTVYSIYQFRKMNWYRTLDELYNSGSGILDNLDLEIPEPNSI